MKTNEPEQGEKKAGHDRVSLVQRFHGRQERVAPGRYDPTISRRGSTRSNAWRAYVILNVDLAKRDLLSDIVRNTVIRMETVTISPKFQIVIPQKIREAMGLRSGEKARMLSFRNRIEVIPVRDVRSLRGYLKGIDTSLIRDGDRV